MPLVPRYDAPVRPGAVALLLAAACSSTRPLTVPPPYDESGILVTVDPRAHIDWIGFETIRGSVENRTGRTVDLRLYLSLEDGTGAVVGHAFVLEDGLSRGEKRRFEIMPEEGPPSLRFGISFKRPHYAKVAPAFAYDDGSIVGFAVHSWRLARAGS
jgi:hypothetical protein